MAIISTPLSAGSTSSSDVAIRKEIERRKVAEAKLNKAWEELKVTKDSELMYARKAALLSKELRDEKIRHATASELNDLQVQGEKNRREELYRKDTEVSMVNGDGGADNKINLQFPTSTPETWIQTVESSAQPERDKEVVEWSAQPERDKEVVEWSAQPERDKEVVEWSAQPERDKEVETIRKHINELEVARMKLLHELAEAKDKLKNFSGAAVGASNVEVNLKKCFKPDGSLELDVDSAIARCHDIFICPYEVGHMSLREFLAHDDSKIFRVRVVPGKKVAAHLPEDGSKQKFKKYIIPARRRNQVQSEPDLRKLSSLGKFVFSGIIDCPYKLQRHGLSLNGKFTLDSYRVTADKKIKLDSAMKALVCMRTRDNMNADYVAIPSVIAEILSIYGDISSIPFDLKHLLDLLSCEDPVANEVIIRYNASLMDEILKRDHYITLYDRLEQIEKEDEEMKRKNFRLDKVTKFILAVQDCDDWRDKLHNNEFVANIREKHLCDSTHKSPNEARNLLETWRHNFTHLHELSTEFQDKDEVDIMDSVIPGVINEFQQGMHSIGELDIPHLAATMKQ